MTKGLKDKQIIEFPGKLLGRTRALALGYDDSVLNKYASISQQGFAGAGNPFLIQQINAGEVVVDIGCGTGTDACIASGLVGRSGRVFGIELDIESVAIARNQAHTSRLRNITFTKSYAEKIPLPDACADVVISNGTLSQCVNKKAVIQEIYRILKPGGRIQMADVLVAPGITSVPNPRKYTNTEYLHVLRECGFEARKFELAQLDPGAAAIADPDPVIELNSVHILATKISLS